MALVRPARSVASPVRSRASRGAPLASVLCLAALCLAAAPADVAAQRPLARFRVDQVEDTTFTFALGAARWVRPGRSGMVLDPARRDALVAAFRVMQVGDSAALAVITGQTTRVNVSHVAVLEEPPRPFWRESAFWAGLLGGALAGLLGGLAL